MGKSKNPLNKPERTGLLKSLELAGVGPARTLRFEPGARLNLIAGDNGLGKSFLLDCAWWALTGQWAGFPAHPREEAEKPEICFEIASPSKTVEKARVSYVWDAFGSDKWANSLKRPVLPGLAVYARVDGSFAVFDPARREERADFRTDSPPRAFVLTKDQVENGFEEENEDGKRSRINGLIRDWVGWQYGPDRRAFETLTKVLDRLSPPMVGDLGKLRPGAPMRLPGDSREIPTLIHPHGKVPIFHVSAGVHRIITLAYLLVWTWREHEINSRAIRKEPERRIAILIDEIEAHLHPQWQRSILPSLLEVGGDLSSELTVQFMIATHSPLVIASSEPYFNPKTDKLFHLDFVEQDMFGTEAEIHEVDFVRRGRVGSWLTSEVFDLKLDYGSLEAENAIEDARRLQQTENPSIEEIKSVSEKLVKYLSDLDVFWPRWVAFSKKHGVEL